jgi:hypothetical protein
MVGSPSELNVVASAPIVFFVIMPYSVSANFAPLREAMFYRPGKDNG